jgi:hypothetical protein
MESTENINQKIIWTTKQIRDQFPELLDFLNEMPVTIPNINRPEIDLNTLTLYCQSLISLKEKYEEQLILKQKQHD